MTRHSADVSVLFFSRPRYEGCSTPWAYFLVLSGYPFAPDILVYFAIFSLLIAFGYVR